MLEIPQQQQPAGRPLAGPQLTVEERREAPGDLATVAVAGLGYVGLPVAVPFGHRRRTIGVRQGCLVQVKPVLDPAAFRREGIRTWRL